jgi:NitT/TauT family transport system ATP-binding protein
MKSAGAVGLKDSGVDAAGIPITYRGVTKTYGSREGSLTAVQDVSAEVGAAEFVSLVGPSGCGKTTLLMMTAGLKPVTRGEILVGDRRVQGPQTECGVVFQDPTLLPWRNVLDNVMLQIEIRRLDKERFRQRALDLLESAGLAGFEGSHPHELSGGMRQRVSLVRALIHEPQLLLMDEPFGALDAITRDQMNIDIQKLWLERRQTVLFVTHSVSEAIFLSDRVLVISPRPARIDKEIVVDLRRPRTLAARESPRFGELVGEIREVFLSRGVLKQ